MPTTPEKRYGVWLNLDRVGTLNQRGDYTWFTLSDSYLADPSRAVLGLVFEQDLRARHASALRLPPWFSNLLPEGQLRNWIADDRGVSVDREMELLAQVGHDLPGAVRVLVEDEPPEQNGWEPAGAKSGLYDAESGDRASGWRFSLAGVGLKFSMLRQGDRLTLPAFGEGGDWIVKLPDPLYSDVPRNEYAMMSLAEAAGIEVPEHILVPRGKLDNLPSGVWKSREENAYAVRRFDRSSGRTRIHIEDFAQVRNVYPYGDGKYQGNLETIAAFAYRRRDLAALREFARRVAFNILISNGDAHLKNWSLIYRDPRIPTLSPAYDLVSTATYREVGDPENLGLKFGGTRRFEVIGLDTFARLQERLDAPKADLPGCVAEVIERVVSAWPDVAECLAGNRQLQDDIGHSIERRGATLMRT
jgi:serine/threonine-protein kinase HipA